MMEMADQRTTSGNTISSGTIPEKKWTHLVIAVDRKAFKTRYYLNGELDSVKVILRELSRAISTCLENPYPPAPGSSYRPDRRPEDLPPPAPPGRDPLGLRKGKGPLRIRGVYRDSGRLNSGCAATLRQDARSRAFPP